MAEDTHNLSALPHEDRLHLLRFVCSFAWADLEIADSEREFVTALVDRLDLDDADRELARTWLKLPPRPEDIDPTEVPREHRQLFLKVVLDRDDAADVYVFRRLADYMHYRVRQGSWPPPPPPDSSRPAARTGPSSSPSTASSRCEASGPWSPGPQPPVASRWATP